MRTRCKIHHKDHFEIPAGSMERQRVSAVAGGKLELPGQAVPKPELGNEGISDAKFYFPSPCGRGLRGGGGFSTLFPSSSLGTQLCRSSSFDPHNAVPKPELGNEGKSYCLFWGAFHLMRFVGYMEDISNHAEHAGDMMQAMIAP